MSHDKFYDNTRLSEAKRCLRKYFFRHVLDFETKGFDKNLVFGSAWHEAMDVVWVLLDEDPNLAASAVAGKAYEAFLSCWLEEGGTHPEELDMDALRMLNPKHPMIALEMLYEYVEKRRSLFKRKGFKLLAVEHPFAVPLSPEDDTLFYVGRLDKVFALGDDVHVGEHKTSSLYSVASGFRNTFLDSFSPNSQVDGYLHAGKMLYGERFKSVWIDAALCHKTEHDVFKFIPVDRQDAQLDSWLYDTTWWISVVENNWDRLRRLKSNGSEHSYLTAFPKNTNSCMDFARPCPYLGICRMLPDPSTMEHPPEGFQISRWSPFERLELETIGMKNDQSG